MKFKYLIIDEEGNITGANHSTDNMKQMFETGIVDVIDCEHGERLINWDVKEWENIEPF